MTKRDAGSSITEVVRNTATNILAHFKERSDEVIEARMAGCSHRGDPCGQQMWREIKEALDNLRSNLKQTSDGTERRGRNGRPRF